MNHNGINGAARPPYQELVGLATRAPSVHNTQPWLWRSSATGLDLFADWARQLHVADPDGRDVLLSCGAALHHLRVAAAGLGWDTHVRHVPDPDQSGLLASVAFAPHETSPESRHGLTRLKDRQTDRRRFADWPVPREHLESLARTGNEWGAMVTPVMDDAVSARLVHLTVEADERQRSDPAYATELARWSREREHDGVPARNVPEASPPGAVPGDLVPQRFAPGTLIDEWRQPPSSPPGLLVIATSSDDVLSRLRAGEALSAMWLDATGRGLVAVPLSQATEVDKTRRLLARSELDDRACPQILLCLGWPRADLAPLPFTPRRPVSRALLRAD
jgi:hypothetical protein